MENAQAIRDLLFDADTYISQINVSGENVFRVADARKLLRAIFDMVPDPNAQPPEEDRVAWREGGASG